MKEPINNYIMKKYIIIILAILPLGFIGCKKDKASNNVSKSSIFKNTTLDPITDFMQTIRQPFEGNLVISNYTTMAMQATPCTCCQFRGGYSRKLGGQVCLEAQVVTILGKQRVVYKQVACSDPIGCISHPIQGTTITLAADEETMGSAYEHDFYVPTDVHFNTPSFMEGLVLNNTTNLTWNTDEQNPKGDVIYIAYDPNSYENAGVRTGYPNRVAKGIPLSNDAGSYSFSSEDFSSFPDGAHLQVYICRYNWEIFTDSTLQQDFLTLAGSSVMNTFTLDK